MDSYFKAKVCMGDLQLALGPPIYRCQYQTLRVGAQEINPRRREGGAFDDG